MLQRIKTLMESGENFAFETTLTSKSFVKFIQEAKEKGYDVSLLFLYLDSPEMAISRVHKRVKEGGHNIPVEVIKRRYKNGLRNFFKLYSPLLEKWIFVDNSSKPFSLIAKLNSGKIVISQSILWAQITEKYDN